MLLKIPTRKMKTIQMKMKLVETAVTAVVTTATAKCNAINRFKRSNKWRMSYCCQFSYFSTIKIPDFSPFFPIFLCFWNSRFSRFFETKITIFRKMDLRGLYMSHAIYWFFCFSTFIKWWKSISNSRWSAVLLYETHEKQIFRNRSQNPKHKRIQLQTTHIGDDQLQWYCLKIICLTPVFSVLSEWLSVTS